jgi:O-antigen ligase
MGDDGKTRSGKPLALGIFYAIGFLSVVFMSGERMALLLTGLGFVLAFFMLPISKRLMLLIGLGAAACIALLAYTNQGLVERHLGSTTKVVDDIGASDYGKIWLSAIEIAKANPVFGVGLKQFREVCPLPQYGNDDPYRCNQHTHNIYLEWLAEAGIIGFGLFTTLVVLMVREMLRALPYLRYNPIFLGLAITLCIRLWPLASTTSFFTAWSAVPMWLIFGWMLTLTHAQNDQSKDRP